MNQWCQFLRCTIALIFVVHMASQAHVFHLFTDVITCFQKDPYGLKRRSKKYQALSSLAKKLQLQVYCSVQLGRHWEHFKENADKSLLRGGWDVLDGADFMQVSKKSLQ